MLKPNIKNERVKKKFFKYLKEALGRCESTINNIEKAIWEYEDFTKKADFSTFNPDKAIKFKEWLHNKKFRGKAISLSTQHTYLRYLRKLFNWLSQEPGYKSKIKPTSVHFLRMSEKDERVATQQNLVNYPLLDHVIKLTDSIKINFEIDKRDRALISFTLLSGMRDQAIVTLPLGCFDEGNLTIDQNPRQGVQTKFSKHIYTTLFRFDDKLLSYVIDWMNHLKEKGFGSQDPLFPRSKTAKGEDNLSFEPATEVERLFWQSAGMMREIFKKRSKDAKLPYYPPHTFRHLAVDLAWKHCKTGEEIKAISQNFGHEHIATTLSSYANYDPRRLSEILKNIDFSGKLETTVDDRLAEIIREIKKRK